MQERVAGVRRADAAPDTATIVLDRFLPYRLSSLAESVSQALAAIYRDRFDLTRPEWRVLATLAREDGLTAAEVGQRAALDKMQVSRGVQSLVRKGDVARKSSTRDRRARDLTLTAQGRRLYERVAPLALAREASLLSVLSEKERRDLFGILDRLAAQAAQLREEIG